VASPRNIAILGSTGSIGRSSLEVIAQLRDRFRVNYLTAHRNIDLLRDQINLFKPRGVVVLEEEAASVLRGLVNGTTEVLQGSEALLDIASRDDVDLVISALVGFAGLKPTLRAVESGKDIALANKETLVVAGALIMDKVRRQRTQLMPVDSEHSAIFQCLQGENTHNVRRLVLTASGGPFLHCAKEDFASITVAQALNHPTWRMGKKITIDSATLMNKGLEVIEAFWLFGIPQEKIEIVIHPQSIIHSMVEFADGSVKAQMGVPDMKLPIHYALAYPDRPASPYPRLDFSSLGEMTFLTPDLEKFECLPLAFEALRMGGTAPAVLNAANEAAVQLFLEEEIPFSSIPAIVREALHEHTPMTTFSIEDLERIDTATRSRVRHNIPASTT
jgi:1-deoxy-D-xylulose-5-phosphate reductoisomerase